MVLFGFVLHHSRANQFCTGQSPLSSEVCRQLLSVGAEVKMGGSPEEVVVQRAQLTQAKFGDFDLIVTSKLCYVRMTRVRPLLKLIHRNL